MNKLFFIFPASAAIILAILVLFTVEPQQQKLTTPEFEKEEGHSIELKIDRNRYFHMILQDPETKQIPPNIREREINYVRQIQKKKSGQNYRVKDVNNSFKWTEAGPNNVGGRTRAIAFDRRNNQIMLSGGVSGGMWKSTDGGQTWVKRSDPGTNLSVSWVVQHPTQEDTWYYSMGEFTGNSASGPGAFFFGQGLYKSTDNGDTWSLTTYALEGGVWVKEGSPDPSKDKSYANIFNFISKIIITPNGDIFVCSNGYGIYRSIDGAETFERILPLGDGQPYYSEIVSDDQGILTAITSETSYDNYNSFGVFRSSDRGNTWIKLIAQNFDGINQFPKRYNRTVFAIVPSDQNLIYAFTRTDSSYFNQNSQENQEYVTLFLFDFNQNQLIDKTPNLPSFSSSLGVINTQGSYNMTLSVKPDDPNVVLFGGTNLYISRNAFNTPPTDVATTWIGGYGNGVNETGFLYTNHHPDAHNLIWDPANPDILISTHDGGISRTNITTNEIVWEDLNNGYNVTQFYTVSIPRQSGFFDIIGGTQDNGTPQIADWDQESTQPSVADLSSGDGSFCFYGDRFVYVSSQRGRVLKLSSDRFDFVAPEGASGQSFIHPFEINRFDQKTMFYPAGRSLWVNNEVESIQNQFNQTTSSGWTQLSNFVEFGYQISALESSTDIEDRLYLGAYSGGNIPLVYRLDSATSNTSPTFTSLNTSNGAYINDIAVNERNGDELMVICSNYNVESVFYSGDGATTFSSIQGNLGGTAENPGPSIRTGYIMHLDYSTYYFLGTSAGLFFTEEINGNQTNWEQVAVDLIGNNVVSRLDGRPDGVLAVATHGRGIFMGISQQISTPLALPATNISDIGFQANWTENVAATGYSFELAGDSLFNAILFQAETTSSGVIISGAAPETVYFYRVNAQNGASSSAFSNTVRVITLPSLPPPVANEASNLAPDSFTASWNAVDGATSYELWVSSSEAFDDTVRYVTEETSIVANVITSGLTNYYQLISLDETRVSVPSNIISFERLIVSNSNQNSGFFPNPFSSKLHYSGPQIQAVEIMDIDGKVLLNARYTTEELNQWFGRNALEMDAGLYIMKVKTSEGWNSFRVMKK